MYVDDKRRALIGAALISIGLSGSLSSALAADTATPIPTSPAAGQGVEGPLPTFSWTYGALKAPTSFGICAGFPDKTGFLDCSKTAPSVKFSVPGNARTAVPPKELPATWVNKPVTWVLSVCYGGTTVGTSTVPLQCYASTARSFVLLPWTPKPRAYVAGQYYFEFKYAIVSATRDQVLAVRSYTDLKRLAGPNYCTYVGAAAPDRATQRRELETYWVGDLTAEKGTLPRGYQTDANVAGLPNTPSFLVQLDIRRAATPVCTGAMAGNQTALNAVTLHVRHAIEGSYGSPADPQGGPPRYPYVLPVAETDARDVFLFEQQPFFPYRAWWVDPAGGTAYARTYAELKYLTIRNVTGVGYGFGPVPDRAEVSGSFGFVGSIANFESVLVVYDGSFNLQNENW